MSKNAKKTTAPAETAAPETADVAASADKTLTLAQVSKWIRKAHQAIPTLPNPEVN